MTASEKAKDKRLQKLFRVSLDEYKQIESDQKLSLLSILMGKKNGLDHDHETGLIRGLLDWRINRALGLIESIDKKNAGGILTALAEYVARPPAVFSIGRRYGLIGKARVKKKMIYGSENGPILPEKKKRKRK